MALPLDGVRVLEVGGGIPAAFAGRLLAGFGADVVRSEGSGRVPLTDDEALYLLPGKRRVDVDAARLRALALAADLVVEDRPPGTLAGWGMAPPDLRAEAPALTVVSVTPFGQAGPHAGWRAPNAVAFAEGGIMGLTGDPRRAPLVTGGSQAEYLGGINAFSAAVTAHYGALVHGEGDWVDLSLQECAAGMLEYFAAATAYGEPVQPRTGNGLRAAWHVYPAADGWGGVFCLERQIPGLFACMDDPELADPRFRNPELRREPDVDAELEAKLYGFFLERTTDELLEMGRRHRVPFGVVATPGDLLAGPGLAARGFFDEVGAGEGRARVPGRPFVGFGWRAGPLHDPGADTATVLDEWLAGEGHR